MNDRFLQAIKKLKENQDNIKIDLKNLEKQLGEENYVNFQKSMMKIVDDIDNYTIVNGYWYHKGRNTGVRAEAKDGKDGAPGKDGEKGKDGAPGKDGKPGKDGAKGKDGKNGKDGAPGKDGKPGAPGLPGKDGETPNIKVGEITSVDGRAEVKLRKGKDNIYYLDMKIPRGPQGFMGFDGKDAKINGRNAIEIEAGRNITIDETTAGIKINASGGGGGAEKYIIELTGDSGTLTDEEVSILKDDSLVVELDNDGEIFTLVNKQDDLTYRTYINIDSALSETVQGKAIYVQLDSTSVTYKNWNKEDVDFPGGSGGTDDFEDLTHRPKYNGSLMDRNTDIPEVPTNTSDLTNDSGFITKSVNDLTNYYLKSETYTQDEVDYLIGQIKTVRIEVVQTLPETGESNVIYFVPKTDTKQKDIFDEYIWVNNDWELIGNTKIDLTGYAKENWVLTQIADFLTENEIQALITTALSSYYTKSQTDTLLNGKQPTINDLDTIRSGASLGATAVQDSNYVHTDNNYTTPEKTKLAGLENYDDTEIKQDIQDLETNKQDLLTAGSNINISSDNIISATDTTYTAGTGIDITNNVISATGGGGTWGSITGTLSDQTDLKNALDSKQGALDIEQATEVSIDTVVTEDSTNLITSGAVYTVVGNIETALDEIRGV